MLSIMEGAVLKNICAIIFLSLVAMNVSADWVIVGAGNATCENWNSANKGTKTEILSWMTGFSNAQSLNFASEKQPTYRLKMLTYDYLTNSINSICMKPEKSNESMSGILFGILTDFPREIKK